jgi:hypothetical protein
MFGTEIKLDQTNVVVVEQIDSRNPNVRGFAHVDLNVPANKDPVEYVVGRSRELQKWIDTD